MVVTVPEVNGEIPRGRPGGIGKQGFNLLKNLAKHQFSKAAMKTRLSRGIDQDRSERGGTPAESLPRTGTPAAASSGRERCGWL